MNIAILGSTGFVGKVLLGKALDAGYQIKTLARNPEKLGEFKGRVEVVQGDYFNKRDLESAVEGTKAVISAIGAPSKNPPTNELFTGAMRNLICIMTERDIKRLVIIGGAATPNSDQEKFDFNRKVLKLLVNSMGRHLIEIKRAENNLVTKSGLDWTIVRPPAIIKGDSTKKINIGEKRLNSLKVPVESLADFLIEQIESREWLHKTPLISA